MTIIGQRLYRTDEKYMIADAKQPDEFCLYDIDAIYPYCCRDPPAPDETMAYIDIIKGSDKKLAKARSWPKWLTWNVMVFALLGVAIAYHFLTNGV